jgi:hypothetical protein
MANTPELDGCRYFDEISSTYSEGIKEYAEGLEEFLKREKDIENENFNPVHIQRSSK